jgi:CRISPR/Cas system endoribonuclease Cas6 (RAMP superfamily)
MYSSRQNQSRDALGFIGTITYNDIPQEFLPYLKIGEYIHIGKETSRGMGKYQLRL